ncbi:ABC transporter substrate-binding protein [Azospirillum canadense]|uniref:ABC transporter substrate-binding protein n=1 Tax=Azospirillum canadense TaxID=403962 RepID=UPI0022276A2F|nr:ABC transporter substrate-binding protein [Azospirillum canadense]MCW2243945.1 phospholipid transport system substrate-binding protein [Azospirillum canadense]
MAVGKVLTSLIASRRFALFAAILAFSALYPGGMSPAHAQAPSPGGPGAPRGVVQGFYDVLIGAMKDGRKLGFQGRFDRIRPAFEKAFNATLMTRVVVGATGWSAATPQQQDQAVDAFTRYSVANYAANFNDFGGEKLEVQGERQTQAGTVVETQIVPTDDKPVAINFLLRPVDAGSGGGGWKISDVFLDRTISELATRRSDFARTIQDEGIAGLIKRLDEKTREIAAATKQ